MELSSNASIKQAVIRNAVAAHFVLELAQPGKRSIR